MNKNILIVLGGGFIIAILVALIVQSSLKSEAPVVVDASMSQVLIASKKIPLGQSLSASDLEWKEWPESRLYPELIVRLENESELDALSGRVRRDVSAGEPLTKAVLLSFSDTNVVVSSLETGMRAAAISVSAASMVGGFINPGDRVDVILTHQIRANREDLNNVKDAVNRFASETILENLRVLAIDQNAVKTSEAEAKIGRTVTLEVSSGQAEKLALATQMGDLSLSLRGVGDDNIMVNSEILPSTDVSVSRVLKEVVKRSNDGGNGRKIRIYSNEGIETISVK